MAERARAQDRQRGITVVETLVVLALMAIVSIPILQVLQSGLRNERQATTRIDALAEGASALEWITADVRSVTELSRVSVGVPAGSALVLRTTSSGREQLIEWRFTGGQLIRMELDNAGQPISKALVLGGLAADAASSSVQLLDLDRRVLDTSATSRIDLTQCTSLVRLQIVQQVNGSRRVQSTDVAIRNSRQKGASC